MDEGVVLMYISSYGLISFIWAWATCCIANLRHSSPSEVKFAARLFLLTPVWPLAFLSVTLWGCWLGGSYLLGKMWRCWLWLGGSYLLGKMWRAAELPRIELPQRLKSGKVEQEAGQLSMTAGEGGELSTFADKGEKL